MQWSPSRQHDAETAPDFTRITYPATYIKCRTHFPFILQSLSPSGIHEARACANNLSFVSKLVRPITKSLGATANATEPNLLNIDYIITWKLELGRLLFRTSGSALIHKKHPEISHCLRFLQSCFFYFYFYFVSLSKLELLYFSYTQKEFGIYRESAEFSRQKCDRKFLLLFGNLSK